MKKFLSTLLALCLTLSLCMQPVSAASDMKYDELDVSDASNFTDEDFFIREEVAGPIAELFIADMVETGLTMWDEDTAVVAIVPMYDATGENVTAYSVEATEGYVVVSAYADVPCIILEWADESAPLYEEFESATTYSQRAEGDSKVIYTGGLDYFLDTGSDTLLNFEGEEVQRNHISNPMDEMRDFENVSQDLREQIIMEKADNGKSRASVISDPFKYLGGTWTCNDYRNYWDRRLPNFSGNSLTQSDVSGFPKACGPIAITNVLKMIGERYASADSAASAINKKTSKSLFTDVANSRYFNNGVGAYSLDDYAKQQIKKYNISATVGEQEFFQYDNAIRTFLGANNLMLLYMNSSDERNPYGNGDVNEDGHIVVGYAYTRLVTDSKPKGETFVKIFDGVSKGKRYIHASKEVEDTTAALFYRVAYNGPGKE